MTYYLHLKDGPFKKIKNGSKTIEMRVYDEKRQKFNVGDTLVFDHLETGEQASAKIVDLHKCKNFEELYSKFDKICLGYEKCEKALPKDMYEYYSESDVEKYGVIGIEIKLI